MPAVSADSTTLARISGRLTRGRQLRRVRQLSDAPSGLEGEGFPVRRAFAGISLADLDPFIHMDQMGEIDYAPLEPRGTDWHPHRGFETVTYIIDGTFLHQDSHGGGGRISDGATQWMTAGRGILHIETPPEELVVTGGLFHGLQLWVNLPGRLKMTEPHYQNLDADQVTLLAGSDAGSLVRLIAGELDGHRGPGSTYTPITVAHATLDPGHRLILPWDRAYNALAYTLSGSGTAGPENAPLRTGRLAVFGPGDTLVFAADHEPLDLYLVGGRPIGEPVAAYGPFVMNTRDELRQAVDDYQAGRLGTIPDGGLHPYRR